MRQLVILTLLITASCPQMSGPDECVRKRVSAGGVIEKHHPRFGGGPQTQRWPEPDVNIPGDLLSFRMIAPFTTCEGDTLAVTVEVLGPEGEAVVFSATPVAVAADDHVESTITFTPTRPGTFTVTANFGEALGTRGDGRTITPFPATDATPVVLPTGVTCLERAWPVSATSIACESENETIAVVEADGGLFTFQGKELVTVDDVLWTETDAGVLERRERQNGVFTLTNQWPGFGGPPVRGAHTKSVAIRRLPDTTSFTLAAVTTAGGRTERTFSNNDPLTEIYFFAGAIQAGAQGLAACFECVPDVVALDSTMLYRQETPPSLFQLVPIVGFDRNRANPTTRLPADVTLGHYARIGLEPLEPFERWPLFVDLSRAGGFSVLFDARSNGVVTSVWPRDRVLRIGPNFAMVTRPDGGIGVAPLPAN